MTTEQLSCGHQSTPRGLAAGYATTPDGAHICYACADSLQAAEVANSQPGDRITLYVSSDGRMITTWTGGVIMRVQRWGKRHPFSRERSYLRAVDVDGRMWSGTGCAGMWAALKLTK